MKLVVANISLRMTPSQQQLVKKQFCASPGSKGLPGPRETCWRRSRGRACRLAPLPPLPMANVSISRQEGVSLAFCITS